VLATLPGFFAMHAAWPGEALALAAGAGFGYLSGGAHAVSRRGRWLLSLGIWGAAAVGLGVACWRDPAVRTLVGRWWTDTRYLAVAWSAGSTPPVPDLAGWPLLLACAWPLAAWVIRGLRTRAPLGPAALCVALLVAEWEFLDDAAARAFWPAVALALLWLSARWAAALAERPWLGRPPAAGRVLGLAAVAVLAMLLVVRLLPLDRPAVDLGALGNWLDAAFPTLAHVAQGTRQAPGTGGGAGRAAGAPGPLAPASPYSLKMVGFSDNDANLGGPLATSGREALRLTVVAGTPPPVIYLRGAAFDTYTGRGWVESQAALYPAPPPRPGGFTAQGAGGATFTLRVQPTGLVTSTLFTVLTPLTVDQAAPAWDRLGNGWLGNPLPPSAAYAVTAATPPDPRLLAADRRAAEGTILAGRAAFALAEDLQLPRGLPARVRTLAQQWTADAATPLAKALAIEDRLLQIPYDAAAPAPAPGSDFVDAFLFQIGQGYCTYYASAMAVMLRSLDIPSRWVVGFRVHAPAPGQTLVVRDTDAHAWVEAYIPPYGWLTFDPTPWGPTLVPRPTASPAVSAGAGAAAAGGTPAGADLAGRLDELAGGELGLLGNEVASTTLPRSLLLVPCAVLAALAATAAWAAHRDRWRPEDPVGSATRLWRVLERVAARNGRPRPPAATPAEFARELDRRWPAFAGAASRLAEAYGRVRFGPPEARAAAAVEVHAAWLAVDAVWRQEAPVRHRLRKLL
jgi:transglutaminase-like putative cysteine protease